MEKEFYKNRNEKNDITEIVKIVTHHWSTYPMKGEDANLTTIKKRLKEFHISKTNAQQKKKKRKKK